MQPPPPVGGLPGQRWDPHKPLPGTKPYAPHGVSGYLAEISTTDPGHSSEPFPPLGGSQTGHVRRRAQARDFQLRSRVPVHIIRLRGQAADRVDKDHLAMMPKALLRQDPDGGVVARRQARGGVPASLR
jgi:hypothetical protein